MAWGEYKIFFTSFKSASSISNSQTLLLFVFASFCTLLPMGTPRRQDYLDRLVVFLAKRDGIDKLVKTFQYVSKLLHWHLQEKSPSLANRAKAWEVSCGLSRKAFRTGRFLTGLNAVRSPSPNWAFQVLAILANGGEMVYFFFDHLLWLSRVGVLDEHLARRMSFVSAFGESFGYVFFVIADVISIKQGLERERQLVKALKGLRTQKKQQCEDAGDLLNTLKMQTKVSDHIKETRGNINDHIKEEMGKINAIRMQRVMQFFAISANLADLVIALADTEPNPFFCHTVTLGISGLVSAWSGWYRNWPSS